jgi:hypothetical protein
MARCQCARRRLGVAEDPLGSLGRRHPRGQFLGGTARGSPMAGYLRGQRLVPTACSARAVRSYSAARSPGSSPPARPATASAAKTAPAPAPVFAQDVLPNRAVS